MNVEIREESPATLLKYAEVPSAFEVCEALSVVILDHGLGGIKLVAERIDVPYVKDYDADPESHPNRWSSRFDLRPWGISSAWVDDVRVGGAVVAWSCPELESRNDVAVLWDLRVTPTARRRGVGMALFQAAERWAAARGALLLKVETQNINAPACRFYVSQGCTLGAVHRFAYALLPQEVQLLWYKPIDPDAG